MNWDGIPGILTRAESRAFKHIHGRLREMLSESETAFRRLTTWLEDCSSNHPYCGKSCEDPKLPHRVIDVYTSDRDMALFESKGVCGRYVALSHSWGTSPRLMATKRTIEDLKRGISTSFLPKTFEDAIQITRRLGVKYIWIDCLCIIQDDQQDWEREASDMARIYRDSYFTISASGSSDSHSGCFPRRVKNSYISPGTRCLGYETPREASGPRSHVVDYEHSSRPGERNRIYLFEEWLSGSKSPEPQITKIGDFGRSFDPISDQPLSSRGWTLQERLLSPRMIHYATDQMYFECESHLVSEDGFKFPYAPWSLKYCISTQLAGHEEHGLSKDSGISFVEGEHAELGPSGRWSGGWLSLVEDYSKRSLSVSNDKLSAVAGVARVIAEETSDHYFAGLWARHMIEDLYWRVYPQEEYFAKDAEGTNKLPSKGKVLGKVARSAEYRAPS